jgi:hypothetical protein
MKTLLGMDNPAAWYSNCTVGLISTVKPEMQYVVVRAIWIIMTGEESGYILIEFLSRWLTCLEFQSLQRGPRNLSLSTAR